LWLVLPRWPSAAAAGFGQMLAAGVQASFALFVLVHVFDLRWDQVRAGLTRRAAFGLLRRSRAYALWSVLAVLYFRIDTVLLEKFRGLHEVGVYGAAYKIFELSTTAPVALAAALLPGYARTAAAPDRVGRIYVASFRRQCWLAGALGLGLVGLAPVAVRIVWTARFASSAAPLLILGAALACSAMYTVNGAMLTALDHGRFIVWAAFVALMINLLCNLATIPRWGAIAASWSTAVTEGWLLFASTWKMRRACDVPLGSVAGPAFIVVLTVGGLAIWGALGGGSLFTLLALVGSAAFAGLFLQGWVRRSA
jgi:O-antigen/teichoic acid export membrane protein